MKFIDEAIITISSGHGGPGKVSFRREKFVPRGGPDGGDGGKGGDLIFRATSSINSLLDISSKRKYQAPDGQQGGESNCTGSDGENLILEVPVGTIIRSTDKSLVLDLDHEGEFVVLKGGRGGKGNWFFKGSVNQAPTHAQPGEPGQSYKVHLELKLMADVGIIGYPNAGKSTLISCISAARPKVADYPFTTLTPSLGVCRSEDGRDFVVADIPGLIPGAHQGVGLGTQFLKHIERTRCFVHLIDASPYSGREAYQDYIDINYELEMYDKMNEGKEDFFALSSRKQIVVLNKADMMKTSELEEIENKFKNHGVEVVKISAVAGFGLRELKFKIANLVHGEKNND